MVTKWSPHAPMVTTEGQDRDMRMPSDLQLRRIETDETTLSRWRHGFESRWGCHRKIADQKHFSLRARP